MPSAPKHVIAFDTAATPPKETVVDDPALVDRPYRAQSYRFFEKTGKGHLAGLWQAEPHLERVDCADDELCHILEGAVRLTDSDGNARIFEAGDSFVVEAGFRGTWENLTAVRKVFFILRPE